MKIITGKTGVEHVTAEDDRAYHAATFGTGKYVLNVGSQFKATVETTNNIVLSDGELLINGTHARIPHGETDTVTIENGTTGYNRIDLIVARYTKSSGLENVELKVIKGETTAGTPTRPEYTEGDVLDGVEIADMPLYAVQLSGVNVNSVTPLFTVVTGLDDVYRKDEVDSIQQTLQNKINTLSSNVYTKTEVDSIKSTLQTNVNNAHTRINTAESNDNHTVNAFDDAYGAFSAIYSMFTSIKSGGTIADNHMSNLLSSLQAMWNDASAINKDY